MWGDEAGGIVGGWLLKLLLIMAVIGVIGYEIISPAVTALSLDGVARDVAKAASSAYAEDQDIDDAQAAAEIAAQSADVRLVSVTPDGAVVVVTVRDEAPTLFIGNISALDRFTNPSATARDRWR